jgi:hypothetical protein
VRDTNVVGGYMLWRDEGEISVFTLECVRVRCVSVHVVGGKRSGMVDAARKSKRASPKGPLDACRRRDPRMTTNNKKTLVRGRNEWERRSWRYASAKCGGGLGQVKEKAHCSHNILEKGFTAANRASSSWWLNNDPPGTAPASRLFPLGLRRLQAKRTYPHPQ